MLKWNPLEPSCLASIKASSLNSFIAPKIIYNGIDLDEIDKNTNSIGIESLRSIFINQLKLIKENVLKEKEDKLSIIEDKLNNESIKNVLKQKKRR